MPTVLARRMWASRRRTRPSSPPRPRASWSTRSATPTGAPTTSGRGASKGIGATRRRRGPARDARLTDLPVVAMGREPGDLSLHALARRRVAREPIDGAREVEALLDGPDRVVL